MHMLARICLDVFSECLFFSITRSPQVARTPGTSPMPAASNTQEPSNQATDAKSTASTIAGMRTPIPPQASTWTSSSTPASPGGPKIVSKLRASAELFCHNFIAFREKMSYHLNTRPILQPPNRTGAQM